MPTPTPMKPDDGAEKPYRLLGYERMRRGLHEFILRLPNELVLQRHPFRWLLDGQALSHAYESFSVEGICQENRLTIVHKFNDDLYVVTQAP